MPETQTSWSARRRARRAPENNADAAIALCTRALRAGAIQDAAHAALLAQRLLRLEYEHAEQQKRRAAKASIERLRAEAALEQARKAVASLGQRGQC